MPSPETQTLRGRNDTQLHDDLEEAHQSLFNLRFQASTRQLADNSQVGKARRRIQRIKTLIREREILAEADAAGITSTVAAAAPAAPTATPAPRARRRAATAEEPPTDTDTTVQVEAAPDTDATDAEDQQE